MEIHGNATLWHMTEKQTNLADLVLKVQKICENCNPLTPITCITGCKTWNLKNQFRRLHEKVKDPSFVAELLNILKNERRLQLLEMLSRERHSIKGLQQELKRLGFNHSRKTITEEYVNPLMEIGLVQEAQNLYYANIFGCRLGELLRNSSDLGNILPPHSECYEETTLDILVRGPKTHEDLESLIPAISVARVLSRLQKAGLAETRQEKDYIFFFKTKRDPSASELSEIEKRVYTDIPPDGVSARKLAKKTAISLRRTYKYLRRLKGKKLVFTRKKLISYTLTTKGTEVAIVLGAIRDLTREALTATTKLLEEDKTSKQLVPDTQAAKQKHNS